MRKFIVILICAFGITGYAVSQQQLATQAVTPAVNMQSVNNSSFMSSGSSYSSAVMEVGASGPHRAKKDDGFPSVTPGTPADVDPNNPQYGPVGDALIPLMLCAGAYLIIRARRRMVRSKVSEKGMEK